MYTGCDCSYDLCKSQRKGNYTKWKFFDYCLYTAIRNLSRAETGKYPVYSGLNGVKMNTKHIANGFFVTYVSTSWKKEIGQAFMKDEGMLIHIDEDYRDASDVNCCDVSWISKFPDECEILFARSKSVSAFKCEVTDIDNGVQTVSLTLNSDAKENNQRHVGGRRVSIMSEQFV